MDEHLNELLSKQTDVFRDPIHGLIKVYPWEKALIETEDFQRLRRIHQLSMTNLIYHGAEHTRFGHSIGVMHIAGRIMDHLRQYEPLNSLTEEIFLQKKFMVRMSALLHDLGHGCFSHIGEQDAKIYPDLIDPLSGQPANGHEAYTRCIIKERLSKTIEFYWPDDKYHMVPHILMILNQSSDDPTFRFFDDIISGQLDCDKMDYLLRDSHYCGVEYGTYDIEKLIVSLRVATIQGYSVLAIIQNGIQTVEAFVLARYWMFIQVYFHKYRRLFDHYLSSFMKEFLTLDLEKSGQYPKDLSLYLSLDDNSIYEKIKYYAKKTPTVEEQRIHYYAEKLYTRKHLKTVFDPPYVHYTERDASGIEPYRRLTYVKNQAQAYLDKVGGPEAHKVHMDLATGSSTKHLFDIKVYNEEQDPDYISTPMELAIPSIPVISKHDGSKSPIQDYSFTLQSISDKKIGILRIYADDSLAEDLKKNCSNWFTGEYNKKRAELQETENKIKQQQEVLEAQKKHKQELMDELSFQL